MSLSEHCSSLSFYGIQYGTETVENFYHLIVKWFRERGSPPNMVGITGPGYSGKPIKFIRGNAKLDKIGFEGIKALSIYTMTPDGKIPMNDYVAAASYEVSNAVSYAFIVVRLSLATLCHKSMLPVAQMALSALKPEYGIGYTRPHQLGPTMYAVGICQGLGADGYGVRLNKAEKEEAMNISRWGDAMADRIWQKGILRDIYPWNFLTRVQLVKHVGSITLEHWIQQDSQRGTLNQLCENVSLWEVEDIHILEVRRELQRAGIIFDWKRYVMS